MWIRRVALLLFFLVVLAGIGVAFAGAMLYDFFVVPTAAMEPTLNSGDRLLVRPLEDHQVQRGVVVVFRTPDSSGSTGALRIVAVGGDVVGADDGELIIDDDVADEDYLDDEVSTTGIDEVRVPKEYVFLLGDNREVSTDSRVFGPVPVEQLTGRVTAIWWPLDRARDLWGPPETHRLGPDPPFRLARTWQGGDVLAPIMIDDVHPRTPAGFAAKGVVGQDLPVSADVFADGHDILGAQIRWRKVGGKWQVAPLRFVVNDRWEGVITPSEIGAHEFVVEAWTDRYATWRHEVEVKVGAGVDVTLELEEGARILDELAARLRTKSAKKRVTDAANGLRSPTCSTDVRLNAGLDDEVGQLVDGIPDARRSEIKPLPLWVDRPLAAVGAWYELFPRSYGGFKGAMERLDDVAAMGFDVVYLPPIHPIGHTFRKGKSNTLDPGPDDVGSPWAIGSEEGGHTAIHPDLGDLDDFKAFVARTEELGLEVALDYALQCSPDHPWVHEHPEWFEVRPDGSIRYAENPPKKYQDIHPINFWPERESDRIALWDACRDVLRHWIDQGVRVFRVDNPHTKPVAFWSWCIDSIRREHPDVIFLAEAFTKPKMMSKLGEIGFSQGYTYFTWRDEAWELREYVEELTKSPLAEWFRPSFWPNTPDILAGPLRDGPPAAFAMRVALAATLVPTFGLYSGYELYENQPASETNEEYLHSEKYEIKDRDFTAPGNLAPFLTQLNQIRRNHPGLWSLRDIRFHHSDNEQFLVYSRGHASTDLLLVVVNLDPHHTQETTVRLDLGAIGLAGGGQYRAHDELGGQTFVWTGPDNYVRLDPARMQVAHIFSVTA